MQKILLVDQNSSTNYQSIQKAIDDAEPGTCIKILSGYYDKIIINKPNLTIEALNEKELVYIVVDEGEAIVIDIEDQGNVTLRNLRVGHTASGISINIGKMIKFFFKRKNSGILKNQKAFENLAKIYDKNSNPYCLLKVKQGNVLCKRCLFSFKLLTKTTDMPTIGILLEEDSFLQLDNSEIQGNANYCSYGIVSQKANFLLRKSVIHNHLQSGLVCYIKEQNKILIEECVFIRNKGLGLDLMGEQGKVILKRNKILFNKEEGIRIGISLYGFILKNEIFSNKIGILLESCSANLINNTIKMNNRYGIQSITIRSLINDSSIKLNRICLNQKGGILIEGKNNFTKIQSNLKIYENKNFGICLRDFADCKIFNNFIYKNQTQGILIQEYAKAKIMYNEIYKNLKANIAIGGQNSGESIIIKNNLYESPSEGLFLIDCDNLLIFYNILSNNYDGIIFNNSKGIFMFNSIEDNLNNGIILLNKTDSLISYNKIKRNQGIGLFLREDSNTQLKNNQFIKNEIDFVSESKQYELLNTSKFNTQNNYNIFLKQKFCIIF